MTESLRNETAILACLFLSTRVIFYLAGITGDSITANYIGISNRY